MRNRFYLWVLFLSGIVLTAFIVLTMYDEIMPEWKRYQAEYNELLVKSAEDENVRKRAKAMDIKLQQIYLGDLNRVDRCTSCHMGVENPLMADAKIPFKKHSGDYLKNHPLEKFGCTVCHFGQGRAPNRKEAHGISRDTYWDYPIMKLDYIQTSCALCHDLTFLKVKGGEKVVAGERLFRQKGCKGCHKLEGTGGVLGKDLDGIGSQPIAYFPMRNVKGEKTVSQWIREHEEEPRRVVPDSQMRVDVTPDEADFLTTYIMSLRSEEIPRKLRRLTGAKIPDEIKDEGESLYKMYCTACHGNGKESVFDDAFKRTIPAIMNPAFLRVADDKFIRENISEGRAGTQMTAWKAAAAGLTDKQIDKIIKYITKDRPKEKLMPFGFSSFKVNIKHGEDIFKSRCVACHGENGEGGIGLNLRNPIVQKADPEFLTITVRDGREGTAMISFGSKDGGLTSQDIADVVGYVRILSKKEYKSH